MLQIQHKNAKKPCLLHPCFTVSISFLNWMEEALERGRQGGGVFKVKDNQFLSAELWGGTPDSEGDPSLSISALLHFLSL